MKPIHLLVVMLVAACSSGPDAQTACADVAQARCERLMACSASDLQRRWGDLTTCETRLALACTDGLAAPDTGATPDTVTTCADAIPDESCPDFLDKEVTDACLPQTGTLATGAACSFSAQCASAFCAMATDTTCGACQPEPAAGASCADAGCAPNMKCVASTMQCQVPVAASGTCSDAMPCEDGLSCVAGVCTAEMTTAGAICDPQTQTAPDCNADDGLVCDRNMLQCVAMPIVAAGMPCGNVSGVPTRCEDAAACVRPQGSQQGTCIATAADGAGCDTTAGPPCLTPAVCVSTAGGTAGTCELPGANRCS